MFSATYVKLKRGETRALPDVNDRIWLAIRVLLSGIAGAVLGNVVLIPMTGVLTPAFLLATFIFSTPLFLSGCACAFVFPDSLTRRPILWAASTWSAIVLIWMLIDRPTSPAATERLLLLAMCAGIAAVAFVTLKRVVPLRQN